MRASLPSRAFHLTHGHCFVWSVELDRLRKKRDSVRSLKVRRFIQTLPSQNKL